MKNNKVVLITGASRGIGKIVAIEFAKSGYDLIILSRNSNELNETAKELDIFKIKIKKINCDISNYLNLKKSLSSIKKIDVLINAASIQGPIGPIYKNITSKWIDTININLIGTYNVINLTLDKFKNGGSIINFSGGGSVTPRENFSSYAVSKSGVIRLTEILAIELKSKNIRVNAISPGSVNTKMFDQMMSAGEANVGNSEWTKLLQQKVTGGNDPLKAAKLCIWLSNNFSKPLTGKTISAVYDNWDKWTKLNIKNINSSDWYTMRRMDPFTVNKLIKI